MYIKEDITIDILKNNGFSINSDLPTFVQEYLNSKYDFIAAPRVNEQYATFISETDFAALMYIFNCLIYVENMEIDHSCFGLQFYEKTITETYRVPQYDGNDVIFRKLLTCPFFIKSPSFIINNIVHPVSFDTKTVYLKLVYYFIKNKSVKHDLDVLLPFGESIKAMFIEASKQDIPFEKVINKLILSQFPSFTDYMESIREYLKKVLQVKIEPSAIKNKKIDTPIVFKSSIFNGMKEGVKIDVIYENYDKSLTDKYYNYFTQAIKEVESILKNNLYAYPGTNDPLIYPYNEEIKHELIESLFRVVFNGEIYFQVLNRVMPDSFKEIKESTTFMLNIAYKIRYSYYSLLKAFYFSYHMCFDKLYGELYYNKNPLIKPRGIILKTDFVFSKITEGIYYPVWTLNQCNSIKNREILNSLVLKTVWHNNKFIMRNVEVPVKNLLRNRNTDMYIFKKLNSLYKQYTPKDTGFDKGEFRYNELLKTGVFDKVTNTKKPIDIKYLDFGGGIGDVGASIAKKLGFLKENSFVTDIQNWLGKEHTEEYAKYITYRYLKTNDLPFESSSIDFITCLQVLHHIPDKKYTLSQLYRILRKGGLILIREHNCENIQDQMLIDLEHSLHAFVVDEQGQDYLQNYNDTYMNKLDLQKMMIDSGFEEVKQNIVFPIDKGITKYYYSLWKAVKDNEGETKIEDSIDNLVKSFKSGFPYMKSYMKPIDTYFSELKNFKPEYSTDPVRLSKEYAKFKIIKNTPEFYVFKEAYKIQSLNSNENIVIILSKKEDYNIDIITNYFTEEARMKAKVCKGKTEGCLSPIEYWNKNLKNVITHVYNKGEELTKYTLREAMFSLCPEATLFKTTVAKTVYDIFKPKTILDMSSGWGDRLIAAIAYSQTVDYNVKYFGYDPNTNLTQGYIDIINTLAGDKKENFGVKTEPFENANLSYINEDVDLVFTSPPYFDFEVYSDDLTQSVVLYPTFTNWCVNFLFKSIKLAFSKIAKDGYLVMHITDTKNMPNICELIILFIEGFIGGKFIGTINTQAPGKLAIPMWVYKNVKNINNTNKQNMINYYPVINKEINKSLSITFKKNWADYSDDED